MFKVKIKRTSQKKHNLTQSYKNKVRNKKMCRYVIKQNEIDIQFNFNINNCRD
jgi:hypothetical protein